MAKKNTDNEELDLDTDEGTPTVVEKEVREFTSGVRLKVNKREEQNEEWHELPSGIEVVRKRGKGSVMMQVIRQASGKSERISSLLIYHLIDFIDENSNRVKLQVEDIEDLDIEDYLALQELVNPEKKSRPIPART